MCIEVCKLKRHFPKVKKVQLRQETLTFANDRGGEAHERENPDIPQIDFEFCLWATQALIDVTEAAQRALQPQLTLRTVPDAPGSESLISRHSAITQPAVLPPGADSLAHDPRQGFRFIAIGRSRCLQTRPFLTARV